MTILLTLNEIVFLETRKLVKPKSMRQLGILESRQQPLVIPARAHRLVSIRGGINCRLPRATRLRITKAGISDRIVLGRHHTHTTADMIRHHTHTIADMIRLPTGTAGAADLRSIGIGVAGTLVEIGLDKQECPSSRFFLVFFFFFLKVLL